MLDERVMGLESRQMKQVKSQESAQTPKDLSHQEPPLSDPPFSLSFHQRALRTAASLYMHGNELGQTALERTKAFFAEFKYNRAKNFLADQATKIDAWKLQLECTPRSDRWVGKLSVKMVYDTSDMDSYGRSENYTAVICEGDSNAWYCLETWEMDIINVVRITPASAEYILSKVTNAQATVAAYEAELKVLANKAKTFDQIEKQQRVDDFHP